MTEREKRIEEMRRVFCGRFPLGCSACHNKYECISEKCAIKAVDADYRKAGEVQKETAQKFLQLWYDDMFNAGECVGHIEKLAKEMGVKIDIFGVRWKNETEYKKIQSDYCSRVE